MTEPVADPRAESLLAAPPGVDKDKWETLTLLDPLKPPKRRRARKRKRGWL